VITQTQADLPAAAEQDLSAAEAKHEELSVDRLPGTETPAATAPPVAVMPKPLPTVHLTVSAAARLHRS